MKSVRVSGTAAVLLFFGAMVPAYPQHEREGHQQKQGRGKPDNERKPEKRERHEQQRDTPKAYQGQGQREDHQRQQVQRQQQPRQQLRTREQQRPQANRQQMQVQRTQQQARAWQDQRGWLKKGGWKGHNSWRANRARHWSSEHRTWTQRGGYGGYYIPDDHFRLQFGRQHVFRIRTRPVIYQGYPRFQYGGFSFLLVDPWPEYWVDNWYDTNDVYIDYDDGYYLYDYRYPDVRLAITVVF